jgi:IS30 family transposase
MAKQISYVERVRIEELLSAGWVRSEIATKLLRDRATIGREIDRNGVQGKYSAEVAQQRAERRKSRRPRVPKMDRKSIRDAVENGLIQFWSPDEIQGRQKLLCTAPRERVSASTVYRWIGKHPQRQHWKQYLRRRGRPAYQPRKPAEKRTQPLANRPAVIERRGRLGDLEGDTLCGQPGSGGLLTLVDRQSRITRLRKLKDKTARRTHQKFREVLDSLPANQRHSTTFDNGTEFARCHLVEHTHGTVIYSADPGCPHQRGTNENTNGLIRQFYPKGIDFRTVTPQDVRRVETLLNNRPRRCLGYRTPNEVFYQSQPPSGCD